MFFLKNITDDWMLLYFFFKSSFTFSAPFSTFSAPFDAASFKSSPAFSKCSPALSAASPIFSPAVFNFSFALSTVALIFAESTPVVFSVSTVVVVTDPSGFSEVKTFVSDCLHAVKPVSYTHLDVYKRQIKNEKKLEKTLNDFNEIFWKKHDEMMAKKFGFNEVLEGDDQLFTDTQKLLEDLNLDYTLFFNRLEKLVTTSDLTELFGDISYSILNEEQLSMIEVLSLIHI